MRMTASCGSMGRMVSVPEERRGEAARDLTEGGDAGAYSHHEILVILGVLVLSILLAALDQTIVSTALPTIAGELHGFSLISWLVTAYLLAQTIAMPIYGKLGDIFGRKWLLIIAVSVFLVGSALSGISTSMWMLIGFRALQGLGAGGLMVTAFSIIGDVIPSRDRAKYLGYIMPIFGLATVFGPTLGGFFIDNFSWRWIFYINLPIGILAIAAAWWKLHLPTHQLGKKKIDYLGTVLLALCTSSIVLLATWGGSQFAWTSPVILGLLGVIATSGGLFVLAEHHAHDPIVPLSLFRNRIMVTCMLLGVTVGVSLFGTLTYLPTYLQIAKGATPEGSGLLMLPLSLGLFVAAVTTGQVISRTGHYKTFPIVGTVFASVGTYLLSSIDATSAMWHLDLYMIVLGLGIGMVMPVLTQVAQNAVPAGEIGVATSGVNLARQLSGAIGVSIAGTLLTVRVQAALAAHLSAGELSKLVAQGARIDPRAIHALPVSIQHVFADAFGTVLPSIFSDFVPILCIGIIIALTLPEIPLVTRRQKS